MARTQQTPGTSIAVRSSSDLATDADVLAEVKRVLITNERIPDAVEDPEAISAEIVAQILAAGSDKELATMQSGAIGWRELLDIPVELIGFRWRPSSFEDGSSVFFVVAGNRLDTGEPVILTTGSRNVLAQLVNMAERGTITGAIVRLVEADKATRQGFKPLWLQFATDVNA